MCRLSKKFTSYKIKKNSDSPKPRTGYEPIQNTNLLKYHGIYLLLYNALTNCARLPVNYEKFYDINNPIWHTFLKKVVAL